MLSKKRKILHVFYLKLYRIALLIDEYTVYIGSMFERNKKLIQVKSC
jgi:hypothetical protein